MARSLNGSTDQISLGATSALNIGLPGSMSAWVFLTSRNGSGVNQVFVKTNAGGSINYGLFVDSSTPQKAVIQSAQLGNLASTQVINLNTWYHIAGTADAGDNGIIYVNGSNLGTSNSVGWSNPGGTAGIGYDPANSGRNFPGSIADVAVWNVVLTAGEISALANGARPYQIRTGSLKGWWPLDGIQSPEPDLSLNANNGTLTGTALAFGPPFMQFTPRWPQNSFTGAAAAASFQPAWATGQRIVVDGIGI